MKRFLFMLLCSVLTLSYAASGSASQLIKANVEKITEGGIADDENKTLSRAKAVIERWAYRSDRFQHDALNPHVLERRVDSAVEALGIIHRALLNQSENFRQEGNDSKIYKYESDQLRIYYTEIGSASVYARAVVIFNLNGTPDVYILEFKK